MWKFKPALVTGTTLLALSGVCGCYAEVTPDADYVEASAPVVDVATYPRYTYRGEAVYYVNDRWYARHRDRWVYYRNEPQQLRRQRSYVQQAPPAHRREREFHGEAPRARRVD